MAQREKLKVALWVMVDLASFPELQVSFQPEPMTEVRVSCVCVGGRGGGRGAMNCASSGPVAYQMTIVLA